MTKHGGAGVRRAALAICAAWAFLSAPIYAETPAEHLAAFGPGDVNDAALSGNPHLVSLALQSKPGPEMLNAALATAAGNSNMDEPTRQRILGLLLSHGANPDKAQNGMPIGVIAVAATVQTAAYLLDHGANGQVVTLSGYELAAGVDCEWLRRNKDPLPLDKMLIARGMDFKTPGTARVNPISCAVDANRIDLVDFLLQHGASLAWPDWDGQTPIFHASTRAMLESLLQRGADLNQTGQQRQRDGTFQPNPLRTPLSTAIQLNEWDKAALLISMGADIRTRGGQLLAGAARGGLESVVTALLDRGVDINGPGVTGNPVLTEVVVSPERQDMARLLLDRGADVNAKAAQDHTALELAVEAGNTDMVRLLLARGADRNIRDFQGNTPLVKARTAELRGLLTDGAAVPVTDGASAQDRADCAAALARHYPTAPWGSATALATRDPGEDWYYLMKEAGDQVGVSIQGRSYLFAASGHAGYLGRVDADGVERIVCEYGRNADGSGALRPLTDYERLQERAGRDRSQTISVESLKWLGVRGAVAILDAARRSDHPVPLQFNSDKNLLGDAAVAHRDDVLAYYLDQGVSPDLEWLDHPLKSGVRVTREHAPALYIAIKSGTSQAVELLLSHGANPNATDDAAPPAVKWADTPALATAVLTRGSSVVESLLAHGATPDLPWGPGSPLGTGYYPAFTTTLGSVMRGIVDKQVAPVIFPAPDRTPAIFDPAPEIFANAAVMFRHGGSPDPWLRMVLGVLQRQAQTNHVPIPPGIPKHGAIAPDSGQTRDVAEAIRSTYPALADLLTLVLRFRDAPPCEATTAPEDLQYCLPKSLQAANSELNTRYESSLKAQGANPDALRNAQRTWISERDETCGARELAGVTQAGWLAYVLADQKRALCVLGYTRERAATLAGKT